ncbi:hypothetical protein DH2020_027223 [Rehmannia glutinosa]|uniref:Protein kinase domain-containing protein n=1 Tax=Rehmannia glutinosa TaxID=99300 RepID=A0ABR0VUR0_REHGL
MSKLPKTTFICIFLQEVLQPVVTLVQCLAHKDIAPWIFSIDHFKSRQKWSFRSDRISKSYQISTLPTPEHSPLHSPTSQSPTKHGNSRNCNAVFVHSHNKSLPESFAVRNETNNANVHPLPRPPTVSRPSPTIRHSFDKSDVSSVKGQWQRGRPIGRGTYGSVYIGTHRYVKDLKTSCCYLIFNLRAFYILEFSSDSETGATCAVKEVEMIPDDPRCAECIKQLEQLTGHDIELSLKGTPHWMAPEVLQAVMRKDANPELAYGVDVWSVGCTVIEMLTGKPPWSEFSGVQAMFNVLNRSPPIPETLSAEGKDFLQRCFQRRPADRPSAIKLLEHPFIRSSQDQIVPGFVQEFSGMKLQDVESTSDWTRRNKDVMPLPSVTRIQQAKLPLLNGETSRQSYPESSDSGATSHNSPRSTLEVLTRISSPELKRTSTSTNPSNVEDNLFLKAVNNNIYNFSCKGNVTLLMPKMAERKKQSCNVQQEIN